MNVNPALLAIVPYCGPGIPIRIKTRPGQALELVQHLVNLLRRRIILRRPGNDTGRQPVLEVQGIGNLAHPERIAAQHRNTRTLPVLVIGFVLQILGCTAARTAGPVELNHHGAEPHQDDAQCRSGVQATPAAAHPGSRYGWPRAQAGSGCCRTGPPPPATWDPRPMRTPRILSKATPVFLGRAIVSAQCGVSSCIRRAAGGSKGGVPPCENSCDKTTVLLTRVFSPSC